MCSHGSASASVSVLMKCGVQLAYLLNNAHVCNILSLGTTFSSRIMYLRA
eukprot:UN12570